MESITDTAVEFVNKLIDIWDSGHASAGLELSGSRGYPLCPDGKALCE